MPQSPFTHPHRVTYADCTVGNHVYYGRYLDFLEGARGEFFRHLGRTFVEWQAADFIFPVIECRLRYKAPARYDDVLDIEVWPTAAEGVRLNFSYRIRTRAGVQILLAETAHVCTGVSEKLKRLPPELISSVAPYLNPA